MMNIAINEYGQSNSESIIFLHGLGVSSWMWNDQIELLKEHYHCVAIDLPGSGDSYQAKWESFADTADLVASIIRKQASRGTAHVVGLSLGGYVALHLLSWHPNLVRSMFVSGVTTRPLVRQAFVRPLSALASRIIKWPVMGRLSARLMQFPEEIVPVYLNDLKRLSADKVKRVYEEVFRFALPKIESDAGYRLLLAGGDKEAKAVLEGLERIASTIPNTTAVQAPNAHHGWNGEHPELFTALIDAWISKSQLPKELKVIHEPDKMMA